MTVNGCRMLRERGRKSCGFAPAQLFPPRPAGGSTRVIPFTHIQRSALSSNFCPATVKLAERAQTRTVATHSHLALIGICVH